MNTMKRLIAVMLILTIALCVVACTQPQDNGSKPTNNSKPTGTSGSTTTQPSSTTKPGDPEPTYFVKVVDENGAPVAGIIVSLCDDNGCYDPAMTDAEGIAVFYNQGLTGAKAVVFKANGYEFSTEYTKFEGSNTITITVTAIAG